jgi:hypothetical protein
MFTTHHKIVLYITSILIASALVVVPWDEVLGEAQRQTSFNESPGEKLPVDSRTDWPLTGVFSLVVDDGYDWTRIFADSLAVINSDSGLAGTPWEMGITVVCNARGVNEFGTSNALTLAEVRELSNSPYVEIGSHGWNEFVVDPFGGGGTELNSIRAAVDVSGEDSISVRGQYFGAMLNLRDTLGLGPIYSHGENGHRNTPMSRYYALKTGFKNLRAGAWIHRANEDFNFNQYLNANSPNNPGPVNAKNGQISMDVRQNMDTYSYWASGFDINAIDQYSLFSPFFNRMNIIGWRPANATEDDRWDDGPDGQTDGFTTAAERIADFREGIGRLADYRQYGMMVWHNIRDSTAAQAIIPASPGGANSGIDSLATIFREIASLSRNGLLRRDAPYLKAAKFNEGCEIMGRMSHLTTPVNVIDNFMLGEGQLEEGVPYGFAPICSTWWADSGYTFVDSTTAVASAGSPFGMENDGGVIRGLTDNAGGGSPGNFHNLVMVFPVRPNMIADFFCYANASDFRTANSGTTDAAEWLDIEITEYRYSWDPQDTTYTFAVDGAVNGPEENVSDFGSRKTSADWVDNSASGANFYERQWYTGRWHSDDDNATVETMNTSATMFERASSYGNTDEGKRWKPFEKIWRVGPFTDWIKIEIIPTGFTAHPTPASGQDTLQIAGIELMLIP